MAARVSGPRDGFGTDGPLANRAPDRYGPGAHVRKGRDDSLRSGVAKVTALPLEVAGPVPDVIARAKAGDRGAFAELYDHHVDSVYRYLLYRVREPSDAEDVRARPDEDGERAVGRTPSAADVVAAVARIARR